MNIKLLKKIIKEEIGRNLRTYDPNNPTGTISDDKILSNYVNVNLSSDASSGRIFLNIHPRKNIENNKIKFILDKILPVNSYFEDYNEAEHNKNLILQQIKTMINNNANIK